MKHLLLSALVAALVVVPLGCNDDEQEIQVSGSQERSRELSRHIEDLDASNPSVRRRAAEQLGQMQAREPEAVEALGDALRDPDRGVRVSAAESLGKIGNLAALEELRDASHQGYQEARQVYTNQTTVLHQRARQGDAAAANTLDRLGEQNP
ncbi:MAG: HEAT repeat domain-containing protein [Planctomycetes bacterium]|jgi:HEAT repeat protein|nr:HEAT repeat domain-containing protein [Planctomycetota bacterium]